MLALITMLVPITNVSAKSFTSADNIVIGTQYHEYFKSYFGDKVSYKYFPYSCYYGNSNRTCYFGIDSEGNYIDIKYREYLSGSYNNYETYIETGIDENFSVIGNNVITVSVSNSYVISIILVFIIVFLIFWLMLGVI